MPRPVHANAEATKGRILETAARLFSARGAGDTSIRDIAKQAGVSLAMVLHYFGSKDELYRSSIDLMYLELAELRAELERALSGAGASGSIIERAVGACFRFARAHRAAVRLVLRSVVDATESETLRREKVLLPFLEKTAPFFRDRADLGDREVRLALQSIVFLIARYSVGTKRELALAAGIEGRAREEDVLAAIEAHICRVAKALLLPEVH